MQRLLSPLKSHKDHSKTNTTKATDAVELKDLAKEQPTTSSQTSRSSVNSRASSASTQNSNKTPSHRLSIHVSVPHFHTKKPFKVEYTAQPQTPTADTQHKQRESTNGSKTSIDNSKKTNSQADEKASSCSYASKEIPVKEKKQHKFPSFFSCFGKPGEKSTDGGVYTLPAEQSNVANEKTPQGSSSQTTPEAQSTASQESSDAQKKDN